jgi:hypothetical protein
MQNVPSGRTCPDPPAEKKGIIIDLGCALTIPVAIRRPPASSTTPQTRAVCVSTSGI